jgi:hypothetical protein
MKRTTFGQKLDAWKNGLLCAAAAATLAGCASTASMPTQPEVDAATGQTIQEAGDIVIVGQLVSHSIMDLPEISGATVPPLVQFAGVTSAINGPVDTLAYTDLLRDRLLLLTREKLRFVERQLPPLGSGHKHHGSLPLDVNTDADYRLTAVLRGNFDDDTYIVQVDFSDLRTSTVPFSGVYRIRKEAQAEPEQAVPAVSAQNGNAEPAVPASSGPAPDPNVPLPPPSGSSTFQ